MRIKFEDWNECKKIMLSIARNLEEEWDSNDTKEIINIITAIDKLPHSDEIKIYKMINSLRSPASVNNIIGHNYKVWLEERVNDTREMFEYYDVK